MKKFLVVMLATLMVLGVSACKKADTPAVDNGGQAVESSQQQGGSATEPEGTQAASQPATTGYSFSGYTETGDWPGADAWAGYGLPDLALSDDVSGTVHISDKGWIYPLNGTDGIMFDVWPASPQFDAIVETLQAAGIAGESVDDGDKKEYTSFYDNGGTPMKLYMYELVYSGKLSILVVTNPTDAE